MVGDRQMSELEPVLRCDSCQALVKLDDLHKLGTCNHCGNKRVRDVLVLNDEEKKQVEEWGFDDFLSLFEVTGE